MDFDNELLKKILLEGDYIEELEIKKAEDYIKEYRGSLIDYLFYKEIISKDMLGQAIADYFNIPYSDLNSKIPPKEQVLLIPEDVAKKFRAVLFSENKNKIIIATDNPDNPDLKNTMQSLFPNKKIIISFSISEDIDDIFINYTKGLKIDFSEIMSGKNISAPDVIDKILERAISLKVSDIHFEPEEDRVNLRFRIDGVLQEVGEIPKEYYENIVSRLKIQAKLRIDEHFSAQDGAIRYLSASYKEQIDLRISIIPLLEGEKIVIRILSSYVRDLTLNNIGLSENLQKEILKSIKKPFGMILVTGPTGSGKTTTLYSLIKIINTKKINITTIEDPVEYKIKGVNQIQVNDQTNLTFAKSLRSIMRQDPNIIFVGEIRDFETAEIATNAALTGHLLLSTFHANDASSVIPRLIDMGIEPFLVGSTIELIISQRLVRRTCDFCKVSYSLSLDDLEKMDPIVRKYFKEKDNLYKGKGCESCSFTGFKGRVGVFEFLSSSPELQDLISKNSSAKDILKFIKKKKISSMFDDGIEKVKSGITTIDELLRVVNP